MCKVEHWFSIIKVQNERGECIIYFLYVSREKRKPPRNAIEQTRDINFDFDLPYDWLVFAPEKNEAEHTEETIEKKIAWKETLAEEKDVSLHILDFNQYGIYYMVLLFKTTVFTLLAPNFSFLI